jgi:hypothetical protein
MTLIRSLLFVFGLTTALVGTQLPWGQFTAGGMTVPLEFIFNLEQMAAIVAVVVGVIGFLGINGSVSPQATGILLTALGAVIAGGSIVLIMLIDGGDVDVDPTFPFQVSKVSAGPAGFVVAVGGLLIMVAGVVFASSRMPYRPPRAEGGGVGPVPPGWYSIGGDSSQMGFWDGKGWKDSSRAR